MRTPRYVVYVAAAVTAAFPLVLAPGGAISSPSFAHWSQRSLVVSDRTGDAGWQEATRRAVETWNAVGSNLTIAWADGGVGCEAAGVTIPVCRDALPHGWKGATAFVQTSDGHLVGARIRVAADRQFTQAQRDTIACHELGHALGLDHSGSAASCLTQGSLSTAPDAHDSATLRASHAHRE